MLKALLAYGYLPRELPPLFGSESFAALGKITTGMPARMTNEKADWTQSIYHNLARVGGLRRRLTVPNPINFYTLLRGPDIAVGMLGTERQGEGATA